MSVAVYLVASDAAGGKKRAGWLVLDSLPFFVREDGQMDVANLYSKHGATVRATVHVSAHEYRRYASGRFLQ